MSRQIKIYRKKSRKFSAGKTQRSTTKGLHEILLKFEGENQDCMKQIAYKNYSFTGKFKVWNLNFDFQAFKIGFQAFKIGF